MKYHPHRSVLFVTLSVEEGLYLLANPLCNFIIQSCLARAQALYNVTVCHAIAEGSHLHLILVVNNPDDLYQFIGYFKGETAHRFNRLLGRTKRTIWCEGYDSPVILTPLRALIAIAYLYSNPAKDNLEDSIDNYPAFSTWKMFRKNKLQFHSKWFYRDSYQPLPPDAHNLRGYSKATERLLSKNSERHTFHLNPNAWMDAFGITSPEEQQKLNSRLIERIRLLEARARKVRASLKKRVMGRDNLIRQPIDTLYRPKSRRGKRTWCITEVRAKRIEFINFLKKLREEGKKVRKRWMLQDYSVPYPLGLYPPSMPKVAEPLGTF